MENKLITTDGLWYKIKNFFKKFLFYKKNKLKISNENSNNNLPNSNFKNSIRDKFSEENMKQDMAKKLLYGEIGVSDLNENEVDEMTEYFKNDIKNIDNELIRIKKHILSMQQSLKININFEIQKYKHIILITRNIF